MMPASAIGRTKTTLVFRDHPGQAVLSTIVARFRRGRRREGLIVRGPVQVEPLVLRHIEEVLIPIVFLILELLGAKLKPGSFELSVVNLDAASAADTGLTIDGFSADAAILLALLSAALRMALAQDLVITGHIASTDGDIRAVAELAAKLDAAIEDGEIQQFICPALTGDHSLQILSPTEVDAAQNAVVRAKARLQVVEVADLSELFQAVWSDEALVRTSLRWGYFPAVPAPAGGGAILERAAMYLGTGHEERFWRVMASLLQDGDATSAGILLAERMQFHVTRKEYPAGVGRQMFAELVSVPPMVRQSKLKYPLVAPTTCFACARFAVLQDYEDTRFLMDAILGRLAGPLASVESVPAPDADSAALVQLVISEISPEALARKIGLPIDAARAAYVLDRVVTDSYEEFQEVVRSFYTTLVHHTGAAPAPADPEALASESLDLVERAFHDQGGITAAWADVRWGSNSGLRGVLDAMTRQYKLEQQSKHVNRVTKAWLDPLDWPRRVDFTRAFFQHIGPQLPADLRCQPPERFARHYEAVLHTYARSFDRVKELLRSL